MNSAVTFDLRAGQRRGFSVIDVGVSNLKSQIPAKPSPSWPLKPGDDAPPLPMLLVQNALKLYCRRTSSAISRTTFYRWINAGLVNVVRVNSRFLIPLAEVERIVALSYAGERL